MRIVKISIEGLFGTFDHPIPFNKEERITIIHSPNGFGKTAILRLLDGVFNSNYSAIRSIPFKKFSIAFDDKKSLIVEKANPKKNGKSEINFVLSQGKKEFETYELRPLKETDKRFYELERFARRIPYVEMISPDMWLDNRSGEIRDLEDLLIEHDDFLPLFDMYDQMKHSRMPGWLVDIQRKINVHFIKTERLQSLVNDYRRDRDERFFPYKPTVSKHSEEVKDSIRKQIGEYASQTQNLERTFPRRLVQGISPNLTLQKLKEKLINIEDKRKELISTGLLEEPAPAEPSFFIDNINETNMIALSLYAEDMTKKLKIFDELSEKIEIFKDIINSRFQYKQMRINKDKGITFITDDGIELPLRSLSSGEQHELVLFYEFLFKVKENSLILIDEPEISLHVGWQMQFLKDLGKVTQNAKFDVLLATHSPQIINDRWDLTIELKGKQKKHPHYERAS